MIKNSALLMITFVMLTFGPLGRAQDQEPPTIDSAIAVVRANMKAGRTTLITTGMNFNDKDGAAFWPIYQQYEYERSRLDDRRAVVIKEYTQKYPNLTDAEAKAMADQMLDCDSRLAQLKKKYYKKFNKVFRFLRCRGSSIRTSRRLMMDMQVEASLPPLTQANTAARQVAWQNRLSNEAGSLRPRFSSREHSMFNIMKRPVIVGAMLMSAVMALAQTQVQRNVLGARLRRAGDSHSKPWTCVRGCAGPGANH